MSKKGEDGASKRLSNAELAQIALGIALPKSKRLPREWVITPEDLEGMSDAEKAEWLALARNARLITNRGLTRNTKGNFWDLCL